MLLKQRTLYEVMHLVSELEFLIAFLTLIVFSNDLIKADNWRNNKCILYLPVIIKYTYILVYYTV